MPFEFPKNVAGWLYPNEGETLQNLAIGKRVVEIGAFKGLSTIIMARVAKVVVSIDPFDRCHVVNGRDTFPTYRENIYCHNVASKIVPCVGPSTFVCPLLRRDSFDVAFIDGEHTYEAVRDDIACVEPLMAKGGVITFHDYGEARFAGVKQAIDEWRKDRRFEVVDSLAIVWL